MKLTLDDWDRLGRDMPCLVNLMPSGKFLMEDFYYAGGLAGRDPGDRRFLHKKALTVNGKSIWDNSKDAVNYDERVITPLAKPFKPQGGIAVLRGNLAPQGAVLKPSAATPKLMKHKGRAVVFEDIDDLHKRIDDPKLDVDPTCVLVLKNCGPKGYPGFPEVGNFALPAKLLKQGVTDMVRISDARMSGTAYGTVVLHTCARSRRRRTAGAGAERRRDRARRREAPAASARLRRRSSHGAARSGSRRRRIPTAAGSSSTATRCCRRTRASTSISWSASRARRSGGRAIRTPRQSAMAGSGTAPGNGASSRT